MDNKQYLFDVLMASLAAGHEIMSIYTDPAQDFGIERKADNSPLTLADKASHRCITAILSKTGLPILSEEGIHDDYAKRAGWERFWLIDPLDGTKEFIKKNGEFTVNIALIEKGEPVMGFVYLPVKDVLYYGIKGTGACRVQHIDKNFREAMAASDMLRVGHITEDEQKAICQDIMTATMKEAETLPLASAKHDDYVIVASRSHLSTETQQFIDEAVKMHDKVRTITSGSSIKICLVAEGTADAYPRYAPTMEWDTAAGDAVARAAGRMCYQAGSYEEEHAGLVGSEDGKPLAYNKAELHNPWFLVQTPQPPKGGEE